MPQHDYNITNSDANTGPAVRAAINAALQALATLNSGITEPATPYAYMLWADTTTGLLKIRNATNTAWVTVGVLAQTYFGLLPASYLDTDGTLAANSDTKIATQKAVKTYTDTGLAAKIAHSLATAANDFLVASGVGVFVKKTLAEVKTLLGLGTAAYLDVGTTANKVLQLNASSQIPAVSGALLTNLPASAALTVSGATVFSAALGASETFQDLDLSGVVGAASALCYFEATIPGGGVNYFCVKRKGYGGAMSTHHQFGASSGQLLATNFNYFVAMTDANGIVQIGIQDHTVGAVTLKLIGYIK